MNNKKSNAGFHLNRYLFISLMGVSVFIFKAQPDVASWLVWLMMITGGILFIVSAIVISKYQNVFDHEPTQFLGRLTTGKKVRGFFHKGAISGGWLLLLGLILLMGEVANL